MNNHFSVKFNSGPSRRQSNKGTLFGFKVNKPKAWKDSVSTEYLPLVSGDGSDSDEELTVHDGTCLQVRQRGPTKSLSTTNLESDGKLNHNGESATSDPFMLCEFLPLELKKDDTLHGIAVKYNCPISDLKRANNIINNQEFFALRELKIPVRKHGLLSEIIKDTQNVQYSWTEEEDTENCDTRTISIGIGPMLSSSPPQEAAEFLRKMDEDLVKIMLNTKTKKDSLEEAAAALSAPRIQPLFKEASSIAQWKVSFPYVIACMLVVVVIPIFIISYVFYTKPSSSHSNSLISNSDHELHYPTTREDFFSKR